MRDRFYLIQYATFFTAHPRSIDLGVGHCFKRSMLLYAAVQQFLYQLSVCGLTLNKWKACVKQNVFMYSTCVTRNVSLSVRPVTKRLISNSEKADFLVSFSYILPMTLTPTSKNRGLYALFDQSPTPIIILFCPFLLSLQSFVVLSVQSPKPKQTQTQTGIVLGGRTLWDSILQRHGRRYFARQFVVLNSGCCNQCSIFVSDP